MAVYILSGYEFIIAGTFVAMTTGVHSSDSAEELANIVRDMSLAVPLDVLLRFEIPDKSSDEAIRAAALKFIAEQKTFCYVADSNVVKGVAPSSHVTASEYIRHCDKLGATASDSGLRGALADEYFNAQTAKRRLRKWSQKFKKVWGLGFGALRTRNPIPEAELKDKAGL